MSKIKFRDIHLSKANKERLEVINEIVEDYQRQGFVLTLRQLYYQLVSRDIIANNVKEYAKLSTLLKEGRMGGIVDWDAIEDRLRKPDVPGSWESPKAILETAAYAFRMNRMKDQPYYLEVWVEKDALSGVLKRITEKYGIPIVVNRGYSSATAMFDAHFRFSRADQDTCYVIYIGDFDPSGQDMIRDITDRIAEFNNKNRYRFGILPIALSKEQIREYNPPPNPAKITDPRAKDYIAEHGPTSWEVDALPPEVLNQILEKTIEQLTEGDVYRSILRKEAAYKKRLEQIAEEFE